MPLNERLKDMLLKDISEVAQQSSRASDTTYDKLPEANAPTLSNSIVSEKILPIQPPPASQTISIFSQQISRLILLPPPPKIPI